MHPPDVLPVQHPKQARQLAADAARFGRSRSTERREGAGNAARTQEEVRAPEPRSCTRRFSLTSLRRREPAHEMCALGWCLAGGLRLMSSGAYSPTRLPAAPNCATRSEAARTKSARISRMRAHTVGGCVVCCADVSGRVDAFGAYVCSEGRHVSLGNVRRFG